jgi:DNA-binding NtrC family response regulator
MKPRLLLVEDDEARAALLARTLACDLDCTVTRTADEALRALAEESWRAAVVDYDLGRDGTGLLVLQAVRLLSERTVRVLYSSHFSGALLQDAERLAGAHAVLDARREEFLLDLGKTLGRLLGSGDEPLVAVAGAGDAGAEPWCARAATTVRMLEELRQAAAEDVPVYVHGESGSGKHLAAATLQRWRSERGAEHLQARGPGREQQARVIRVPPLRERREDLAGLCARFFAESAERGGQPPRSLAAEAFARLVERPWWGNVRELHAALFRAARAAGSRREIAAQDLPRDIAPPGSSMQIAKHEGVLQAVLLHLRTAGSIRAAAALAGETRPNFKRRMAQLGILRADSLQELGEAAEE